MPAAVLLHGSGSNGSQRVVKIGFAIGTMRNLRKLQRAEHAIKIGLGRDSQDNKMRMLGVSGNQAAARRLNRGVNRLDGSV